MGEGMNTNTIYLIAIGVGVTVLVVVTIGVLILSPDSFNKECALNHNHYRDLHGSQSLTVSKELIDFAKERAEYLKSTDVFAHGKNMPYGENLYKITFGRDNPDSLETTKCETAIKLWYDEIDDYDFRRGRSKNGKMIGHFTQLVWTDSAEIGCAKSYSSESGTTYLVCNYNPPGNIIGTFPEKVPRPL